MKLKDATIKALEPSDKVVKLSDGASLFLLVHPSGTKTWTYSYRFDGKQKKLTLGQYPQLSLKMAREARQAARSLLDQGIDPGAQKQASKRKDNGNTFSAIAEDWFAVYKVNRAEKTIAIYRRVLDELILPQIGNADIKDIKRLRPPTQPADPPASPCRAAVPASSTTAAPAVRRGLPYSSFRPAFPPSPCAPSAPMNRC